MEEFIIVIIQFFCEVLLQVLAELPFDFAISTKDGEFDGKVSRVILAIAAGGVIGGLSLLIFPHSLLSSSSLRCVNLLFAPSVSYFLSKYLHRHLSVKDVHFKAKLAFLFTFSLAAIRLAYAHH